MRIGKNQYIILNDSQATHFEYASRTSLGEKTVLLGDGCDYHYSKSGNSECLLLGYAIDTEDQEANESKLISRFLEEINDDASNVADVTLYWGGRWVLIVMIGHDLYVFQDACGLKQVFYADNVIASQSRYVAKALQLPVDIEADRYIRDAKSFDKEYSWPLYTTLYAGIKRLLPNHLYVNGHVGRVSVTNKFCNLSYKERVLETAKLMKSAVNAASKKHRLAVTLTAGWDSRLVLGACGELSDEIDVVTLKYSHISDRHIDVQIPSRLCEKYGFLHKKLECKPLNNDFVKAYKKHSENAHDYWIQMTQSVQDYGYQDWLWTKGSCNEISRNSSGVLYDWQITSNVLSKLYGIVANEYSKKILDNWLVEAKTYAKTSGYSLLDLFYWEQRLGSWLAECLNEADVVGETFTPFNIRAYFEIIKEVPVKYRVSPKYRFFEDVLNACGMDLDIPVNPNRYSSFRSKTKCLIKNKLHLLYGLILNA